MNILRTFLLTAGLSVVAVVPAQAQQTPASSHPWAVFFGCWTPAEGAATLAVTCVLPVSGSQFEVEQVNLVAGNVIRSVSLRADGERRAIAAEGCVGWEAAAFSDDASRVYTRGSTTCSDGTEQLSSGIFSITPEGQFLQVSAVRVGEQRNVTTQRYDLLRWVQVPPVVQERLATWTLMATGARTRASRPVDFALLEDALQFADPFVVEAWMAETGVDETKFRVTRTELERLVAMQAPNRIIDLSVALANPAHFEPRVERASGGANPWNTPRQQSWLGTDQRLDAFCDQFQLEMMNWRGSFPLWSMYPGMGLSYYGWFPECVGRGFYSRWAFMGPWRYGNGFAGSWYGGPFVPTPVVVTTGPRREPGTVTKGTGYTRGTNSTPRGTGQARPTREPSTVRSGGSSASSQSGGSSSSSGGTRSAGSNGSGRTAQPRNPQQ